MPVAFHRFAIVLSYVIAGWMTGSGVCAPSEAKVFLDSYCLNCHDADLKKGGLRLDNLVLRFDDRNMFEQWRKVLDRVEAGEMPPAKKPHHSPEERSRFVTQLTGELHTADAVRVAREGRVVYRRLNREEYQNTVRDLLGIETDLKDHLPEDGEAEGFDNVGRALTISSVLMERYLETADIALDAAMIRLKSPPAAIRRFSPLEDSRLAGNKTIFLERPDGLVFFSSGYSPTALRAFRAPVEGWYRFRVAASVYQTEQPVTFRVYQPVNKGRFSVAAIFGERLTTARRLSDSESSIGPNEAPRNSPRR